MRCGACQGTGRQIKTIAHPEPIMSAPLAQAARQYPPAQFNIPCETCNGSGFSHCCEGERSQQDKKE